MFLIYANVKITEVTNEKISPISCPKNSCITSISNPVINKATIILLIVAFTDCTNLLFMYSSLCYNSDSKGNYCYYRSS